MTININDVQRRSLCILHEHLDYIFWFCWFVFVWLYSDWLSICTYSLSHLDRKNRKQAAWPNFPEHFYFDLEKPTNTKAIIYLKITVLINFLLFTEA